MKESNSKQANDKVLDAPISEPQSKECEPLVQDIGNTPLKDSTFQLCDNEVIVSSNKDSSDSEETLLKSKVSEVIEELVEKSDNTDGIDDYCAIESNIDGKELESKDVVKETQGYYNTGLFKISIWCFIN